MSGITNGGILVVFSRFLIVQKGVSEDTLGLYRHRL